MRDVQMFWSLCAKCVEFLSQRRSGAVLTESRHGEGQSDKRELFQKEKKKGVESVDNLYSIRAGMGSQRRVLRRGET